VAAVAFGARVVLALILLIAAVAKLRAANDVKRQTIELIGERAGAPIARALPFVELAIAIALVAWWTAVPGIAAAVLLAAFTGVLVRAQARQLPCPCFGSVRTVGSRALLRNGVLLAYAVLATASPSGANVIAAIGTALLLGVIATGAVFVPSDGRGAA
jgi:hypothetical protein